MFLVFFEQRNTGQPRISLSGQIFKVLVFSLKLTASLPQKMDGWKTILSSWVSAYFLGWRTVSFRDGIR